MSLRIRCSQCQKKISVDEAFAGSMCRCPYCKMIVRVPRLPETVEAGGRPNRPGMRPERPDMPRAKAHVGSGLKHVTGSRPIVDSAGQARPQRPQGPTVIEKPGVPKVPGEPGKPKPAHRPKPAPREPQRVEAAAVDESQLTTEQLAAIPMANPVFLQGVVSLILIGVLAVVGVASVILGMRVFRNPSITETTSAYKPGEDPETVEEVVNPFLVGQGGPKVCGTVKIDGPVVYLIDGGDSMGDLFLFARKAVRASVLSLGENNSFGIVIAGETQPTHVGRKIFRGGTVGDKAIRPLLRSNYDDSFYEDPDQAAIEIAGAADLKRAVGKSLALKPRTLVMFVRDAEIPDPKAMGEAIADARVRLVLVAFGYEYEEQKKNYETLVHTAGGNSELIPFDDASILRSYFENATLPE